MYVYGLFLGIQKMSYLILREWLKKDFNLIFP